MGAINTQTTAETESRPLVFLLTGLGVGGAERQAVRLAINLTRRGRDVRLLSMIEPTAFTDMLLQHDVPVASLGMTRGRVSLSAFLRLVRTLKDIKPQTLLCFMYHANLMGRLAGMLAGVPHVVVSVRIERFGGPTRELAFRMTNRLSAATVLNSRLAADFLVGRNVVSAGQLLVIPNGIDTGEFDGVAPVLRSEIGIPAEAFLWIAVGRFDPQKDHVTLLNALAATADEDQHLLLVGDGPLRGDIAECIDILGLQNRVHLVGVRHDIPALMASSDALVMSSRYEGLPNVLMEAHAAGLPVVATDVGGVREVIIPEVSGLIVPANDPDALAGVMNELVGMEQMRRAEMGRAGRNHVDERFAIERIVDQWETLLFPPGVDGP